MKKGFLKKYFEDSVFFADGWFSTYMVIFVAFFFMIVLPFVIVPYGNRSHNFTKAQEKVESSYEVYMDGKKMNRNEFDISTLDGQKYDIKFDDDKKEIYLNRR